MEEFEILAVKEFVNTTIGTDLKNSDGDPIKCDGYINVFFGDTLGVPNPYYIPLYDTAV